jgi:hypothetical protein
VFHEIECKRRHQAFSPTNFAHIFSPCSLCTYQITKPFKNAVISSNQAMTRFANSKFSNSRDSRCQANTPQISEKSNTITNTAGSTRTTLPQGQHAPLVIPSKRRLNNRKILPSPPPSSAPHNFLSPSLMHISSLVDAACYENGISTVSAADGEGSAYCCGTP